MSSAAPAPANCANACFLILLAACAGCQDVGMPDDSGARPYRGVEAAERLAARRGRLLAAGLELLGA